MLKLVDLWEAMMYDSSPTERLRVAKVMYRLGVTSFMLWGVGVLAPVGMHGFAKAQDVDAKIRAALDPVNRELVTIKEKLEDGEKIQKRILEAQIAAQLRDLNRLRCSTGDAVLRARLEQDIESAEREYRVLTGERYPLPTCTEL